MGGAQLTPRVTAKLSPGGSEWLPGDEPQAGHCGAAGASPRVSLCPVPDPASKGVSSTEMCSLSRQVGTGRPAPGGQGAPEGEQNWPHAHVVTWGSPAAAPPLPPSGPSTVTPAPPGPGWSPIRATRRLGRAWVSSTSPGRGQGQGACTAMLGCGRPGGQVTSWPSGGEGAGELISMSPGGEGRNSLNNQTKAPPPTQPPGVVLFPRSSRPVVLSVPESPGGLPRAPGFYLLCLPGAEGVTPLLLRSSLCRVRPCGGAEGSLTCWAGHRGLLVTEVISVQPPASCGDLGASRECRGHTKHARHRTDRPLQGH